MALKRADNLAFGVMSYLSAWWYTAENGTLRIPEGTYLCKWTLSPRLKKYTYEVTGVPGRKGIRIHSANFPRQLKGCIALGEKKGTVNGEPAIFVSLAAVRAFNALMDKEDFKLEVR